MDMLYRAYSCPMDLMSRYINQGRFGDFVKGFLDVEFERRKEEVERDNEWRLWVAYVHSYSDESYGNWKERVCQPASTTKRRGRDEDLTEEGIKGIIGKFFSS